MSHFAVLFYEVNNPEGKPTYLWRDVMELGDYSPVLSGYQDLTQQEWSDHLAEYQPIIDEAEAPGILAKAKESRLLALSQDTRNHIEQNCSDPTQRTLTFMYSQAMSSSPPLTDRAAHIASMWEWVDSVISLYYAAYAAVIAATTPGEVSAVQINFTDVGAQIPDVGIASARAITT